MSNIYIGFLVYLSYAFIGWLMEVIQGYIRHRKIINRGFLVGPYCPIYANGALAMILLLNKYKSDLFILFFMSIIIFTILEYFTSYMMEKIFHARWWDYSNRKYNINGRVCLETMIPFGILGVFVMYVINPFLINVSSNIPFYKTLAIILFIIYILDNIFSFIVILKYRKTLHLVEKDSTEEISKKVREIFLSNGLFYRRLVKAFPNVLTKEERKEKIKNYIESRNLK